MPDATGPSVSVSGKVAVKPAGASDYRLPPYTPRPMKGMNVPLNAAYATLIPFANVIHKAREWTRPGSRELANVDALGVPLEPAETIALQGPHPAGVYVAENCTVTGQGVTDNGDGTYTMSGTGNVLVSTPGGSPARLWLPREHWSEGKLWNIKALSQLAEAKIDCLRVAHWMRATYAGGDSPKWGFDPILDERLTLSHTRWSAQPGMPWELYVDLCSRVGIRRLWINPAYGAPADYLQALAGLLSLWIRRGNEVIIEPSIEVWNPKFPCHNLAKQAVPVGTQMPDAVGYGQDAARMCAILEEAFGELPWKFAMMGHSIRPDWLETALSAAKSAGLQKIDYAGCSCYLPAPLNKWRDLDAATQRAYTPEQVIEDMREGLPRISKAVAVHKALAEQYGAKLAIYEGGPIAITGTAGGGTLPIAEACTAAYRTESWGQLWTDLADEIAVHEPEALCWFNWMNPVDEQNGSVGMWEDHETISPMGEAFLAYGG